MATMMEPRPPVQPGDSAPDFTLPSVDRDGTVSLDDYRGNTLCCSACSGAFGARSAAGPSPGWGLRKRSSRSSGWKPSGS